MAVGPMEKWLVFQLHGGGPVAILKRRRRAPPLSSFGILLWGEKEKIGSSFSQLLLWPLGVGARVGDSAGGRASAPPPALCLLLAWNMKVKELKCRGRPCCISPPWPSAVSDGNGGKGRLLWRARKRGGRGAASSGSSPHAGSRSRRETNLDKFGTRGAGTTG